MKKVLLIFAIALFAADMSYGQFALGLKVGYNANKLSTNLDTVKSQFNSGFHVGIWTRIGKRFYVAPEVQYTMSGAVFTGSGNLSTSNWKQKITIGSVDVPLLLGFKIIHSDVISWRIELGPEASFITNKKIEDENSVTGPITEASLSSVNWYIMGGHRDRYFIPEVRRQVHLWSEPDDKRCRLLALRYQKRHVGRVAWV